MKIIALLFVLSTSSLAFAIPTLPQGDLGAVVLPSTFTANYNFEGIVALDNCSGSIVRFEHSQDSDLAMVLTNGHCLESGMPAMGTFVSNKISRRTFRVLDPRAVTLGKITATSIIYGTMTGTDMALYRLKETYQQIASQFNVRPLTMTSQHPQVGMSMEVISGFWKKGYSCQVEAFVHILKEGSWTMNDSIRYSRPGCEVIGGTSGSPIVLANSRTVIGINNTGNEDGKRCTDNNPCEIDEAGNVNFVKGYSYGQQTYQVYSCINGIGQIDLSVEGCTLFH